LATPQIGLRFIAGVLSGPPDANGRWGEAADVTWAETEELHTDTAAGEPSRLLRASGEIDFAVCGRLRAALARLVEEGATRLVVDLSPATLLDAAAVGVLVETANLLEERGGELRAVGSDGLVREVLEIGGLAKRLRTDDTLMDAPELVGRAVVPVNTGSHVLPREVGPLLVRLGELDPTDAAHRRVREEVIELCLPLARHLARRFRNRGEPLDDLVQVAAVGLVNAVDRYDPHRGTEFAAYLIPTIVGEIKRYFRDRGWGIHVPRRLQELRIEILHTREAFTRAHSRSPTVAELAWHLAVPEEEVIECLVASNGYRATSLFTPVAGGADLALVDLIGAVDDDLEAVADRAALQPALASLPERERRIITLRFFGNLSQAQIAQHIGLSQMHVSRLLAGSLRRLRRWLQDGEPG